jgi:hypothetical protein
MGRGGMQENPQDREDYCGRGGCNTKIHMIMRILVRNFLYLMKERMCI